MSTIPAANLPPVSTTPVANCHRYQRHRRQIMGTISGCRHLKLNLKAKSYIHVYSTTQRCPNKINKIFQFEHFCHLPPGGAPWAANISANFRKNSKRPYWYTQGLGGNWFMKKTRSRKSRDTVPLTSKGFANLWYCHFRPWSLLDPEIFFKASTLYKVIFTGLLVPLISLCSTCQREKV